MTDAPQETIERDVAVRMNLRYYFTGRPCKYGHISKRYTNSSGCVRCNEIKRAAYIAANNDKYIATVKASRQRWRERNRLREKLQVVKTRARKLGIPFDLDLAAFQIPDNCAACFVPFDRSPGRAGCNHPTLDRVNNKGGYTKDNVAFICNRCNSLKRDSSVADLQRLIRYIERHTP